MTAFRLDDDDSPILSLHLFFSSPPLIPSSSLPLLLQRWVPSTFLNFAFMPMHLRMPWVASLSFSYMCILSYTRGDKER